MTSILTKCGDPEKRWRVLDWKYLILHVLVVNVKNPHAIAVVT